MVLSKVGSGEIDPAGKRKHVPVPTHGGEGLEVLKQITIRPLERWLFRARSYQACALQGESGARQVGARCGWAWQVRRRRCSRHRSRHPYLLAGIVDAGANTFAVLAWMLKSWERSMKVAWLSRSARSDVIPMASVTNLGVGRTRLDIACFDAEERCIELRGRDHLVRSQVFGR